MEPESTQQPVPADAPPAPVAVEVAAPVTPEPAEGGAERFDLSDLPPELLRDPEGGGDEPAPVTVRVPATPAPDPVQPRMVPAAALHQERERRKVATARADHFKSIAEEATRRQEFLEAQERRARQEQAARATRRPEPKYDEMQSTADLAKALREEFRAEMRTELGRQEAYHRARSAAQSERLIRLQVDDYDEVLDKAGFGPRLALDETHRPLYPDKFSRSLYETIFGSVSPAETAYALARKELGLDSGEGGDPAPAPAPTARRAEAIAPEPRARGIRALPGGAAPSTKTFTLSDIDRLPEASKRWIKTHRPDVWNRYLMEAG